MRGVLRSIPLNRELAPSAHEAPAPAEPSSIEQGIRSLEEVVLAKLDDDQAQDVVSIDLRGKSPVADAMIIASGRSHRHVAAVADHLLKALKEAGLGTARVEGLAGVDWVLIDSGDIIVHIFRPEVRDFYNLEKMWQAPDLEEETLH